MSHYDNMRIQAKLDESLRRYSEEFNKAGNNMEEEQPTPNKYQKRLRNNIAIDVYDVLDAWNVTNPAIQHAIKKALQAGQRGYKGWEQDIEEAIDSLESAKRFPPKEEVPF